MAANKNIRIKLRTKLSGSILISDLSSREITYGNTEKCIFYKDINNNLIKIAPSTDSSTLTEYNTWDSCSIVNYINSTTFNFDVDMVANDIINIYSSPSLIPSPKVDDKYLASNDASNGWNSNHIYRYDTTWIDLTPTLFVGYACFVEGTRYTYLWDGTHWGEMTYSPLPYSNQSLIMSASSILSTDISGCDLPDTTNDCWYTKFSRGESGFWQFMIPSDCTKFDDIKLFWADNETGSYTWDLLWSIKGDGDSLPTSTYDGTCSFTKDSTNNQLNINSFSDTTSIISSSDAGKLCRLKLKLNSGESTAHIYSMKVEY